MWAFVGVGATRSGNDLPVVCEVAYCHDDAGADGFDGRSRCCADADALTGNGRIVSKGLLTEAIHESAVDRPVQLAKIAITDGSHCQSGGPTGPNQCRDRFVEAEGVGFEFRDAGGGALFALPGQGERALALSSETQVAVELSVPLRA